MKAGPRARPIRRIPRGVSFHSSACAPARKDPMAPASMHSRSCPRVRRRRRHSADRLCQSRDPPAGARVGAPPGGRDAPDTRREPLASHSAVADRNPPPRTVRGDRRRHPRLVGERFHAVAPGTGDAHRGCAASIRGSSHSRLFCRRPPRCCSALDLRCERRGQDLGPSLKTSAHKGSITRGVATKVASRRAGRHQPRAPRRRRAPGAHSVQFQQG